MPKLLFLLFLLFLLLGRTATAQTPALEERPELGRFFEGAGVAGTFVLHDERAGRTLVYDSGRAATGYLPASTFKVLNALLALETGVVRDEHDVFAWDGVERGWEVWNQDHTLRSGMQYSVVWLYQEVARRIGAERMQQGVDAAGYGNRQIGGGIDEFWLRGELRITPIEQVDFLRRLRRGVLPFSGEHQAAVREMMIVERTKDYVLRAKTGWAGDADPMIGWWVGYVERGENVYTFATNIDILRDEDAAARVAVTRRILEHLGVLTAPPAE